MSGVFVDSSVFLKILEGDENVKNKFIRLYREEKLYRNVVVYTEVVFVWLRLVTEKKSYELKKNPEKIKVYKSDLAKIQLFLDLAQSLPPTHEIESTATKIISSYGLLPNDALIAEAAEV